uniref:Ubiquitin carboxyl-terminal hydrolase 2 n=1 Tax=Rhizophora mucronata TaxID=61149 RepID=A0A2P2MYW4_RHIMU
MNCNLLLLKVCPALFLNPLPHWSLQKAYDERERLLRVGEDFKNRCYMGF